MRMMISTPSESSESVTALTKSMQALEQQNIPEAERLAEEWLEDNPEDVEGLLHRSTLFAMQGNRDEAEALVDRVLAQHPKHADALSKKGTLQMSRGRFKEALSFYEQAIFADPMHKKAIYNYLLLAFNLRLYEQQKKCSSTMLEVHPDDVLLQAYRFHGVLMTEGQDAAQPYREEVLAAKDLPLQACLVIAFGFFYTGEKDLVRRFSELGLQQNETLPQLHCFLAFSRRYNADDPHLQQMIALEPKIPFDQPERHYFEFALAKALDDSGAKDQAFHWYKQANDRQMKNIPPYPMAHFMEQNGRLKNLFTSDGIAAHKADVAGDQKEPYGNYIFIVGMPRSGTSLAEVILGAHPDVMAGGERPELNYLAEQALLNADVNSLEDVDLAALKKEIDTHLASRFRGHRFLTDKQTENFRYIGLIKTLYPNARIIHCTRHPMATAWSNYKMFFNNARMLFTCRYDTIAGYYKTYQDMMTYWDGIFGEDIFHLSNERLIESPEDTIRRLLMYCGLPWDPACLEFHKSKSVVGTASAVQVKRGLYNDAVHEWRRFGDLLDPLRAEMLKAGIEGLS